MPLDGDLETEQRFQHATSRAVTPPGRAAKASGRLRLPWFLSLAFFVLACIALQQPATAQETTILIENFNGAIRAEDEFRGGSRQARLQFRIRLSGDRLVENVTVAYTVQNGSTVIAEDFHSASEQGQVTLGPTRSSNTLVFNIRDDEIVEGDETFTVTISVPQGEEFPAGVSISDTQSTVTGTIRDDDDDFAAVSLRPTPPGAAEGAAITFTVDVSREVAQEFSVGWTARDGSATVANDLDRQSGTVTIDANEQTATFSVDVTEDGLAEEAETFTVSLTGLVRSPRGDVIIDNSIATGTIAASTGIAAPTVSIEDEIFNESDGPGTFTVTLSAAVVGNVVLDIDVTFTGDTPAGLADLGTSPETVTITSDTTEATFEVPIIQDNLVEGDETFRVTLTANNASSLPAGVIIGDGVAEGTIEDDDNAEVTLSLPNVRAAENGVFNFTVRLSNPVAVAVNITWTATGTAANTDDLVGVTGTVPFAPNVTEQTFDIRPRSDGDDEGNEIFTVALSATDTLPDRVAIASAASDGGLELTITDGDAPVVSIANATVAEGGGSAAFTVAVVPAAASDVVLDVAVTIETADTAVLADLGTLPTTARVTQGQTSGTIMVPVTNDGIVEGNETFTVTLTANSASPLPEGVTITTNTATGTITNDDFGTVTLSSATATAAEDGTFNYTVSLSAAADEAVTVRWTASAESDDTATVADDLQAPRTGTVTFAANTNANQTFSISPVDDTDDEDNETFTVTLNADIANPLPTGVSIGTNDSSTSTITDDDGPTEPPTTPPTTPPPTTPPTTPPTGTPPPAATGPTVSIADARVDEDDGNATFTVTLSRAADSNVVLDIAYAAGSADPASDLRAGRPGAVTIAASDTTATFEVPITDDDLVEGDETFTVTIAVNTASAATGTTVDDGTAEGTIVDDDGSMVTLSPATQTADEDGSFAYTVSISAAADEAIDITWTAAGGTATAADDLRSATGTVSFPANTTDAQNFTIVVADDDVAEDDETFTVTLAPTGVLPAGVMIATAATSTATIVDNDDPSLVNIGDADVDEDDGNATFTVTLSEAVDGNVVLGITYAAGSADPATDLGTGRPATVTIAANRTSATFNVPITNDAIVEGEETFDVIVAVNEAPGGVSIEDGIGEGTIADDDRALVTLTPPTQTAGEDGSFSYTVDLSAAVAEAVAITWTAAAGSDGTATVADDLRSATGTVTFPANTSAARTFTITVVDDDAPEADETFTVTLSAVGTLPAGVTVDEGNATSTATITDNDTPASASIDDAAAAEGAGNVTFTVTLSEAVDSAAVFDIAYAAGSADLTTDLRADRPATVTIDADSTSATFNVPIIDDDVFEADETFTVTLSGNNLPASVDLGTATATGTISNDDFTSILAETRRSAAMSALRRHTGRFERLTGNAVHSRLRGQSPNNGGGVSDGAASGSVARGFDFGDEWNGWLDGSFAGFDGDSEGRQVDLYVGADHLGATGQMVWGVMLGIESAQLDVGVSEYEANHLQIGVYGGALLTDTLIWDGAISYGTGTPDISGQGISADYDAQRFSIRSDLTGGAHALLASGALTVAPQVGVSYVRESLGSFVDSAGGRASEEVLELGRIGAGPRFAWRLDETRELVSSARFQWDMLRDDEDDDTALSGAVDVGARFNPTPELAIGIYVEADGIGNSDKYAAYGGRFELRAVF